MEPGEVHREKTSRSCLRGPPKKMEEPLKGKVPAFWVLAKGRVTAQLTGSALFPQQLQELQAWLGAATTSPCSLLLRASLSLPHLFTVSRQTLIQVHCVPQILRAYINLSNWSQETSFGLRYPPQSPSCHSH